MEEKIFDILFLHKSRRFKFDDLLNFTKLELNHIDLIFKKTKKKSSVLMFVCLAVKHIINIRQHIEKNNINDH